MSLPGFRRLNRDIILISFLIIFISISFLVNIGKEMSLPGFRICANGTYKTRLKFYPHDMSGGGGIYKHYGLPLNRGKKSPHPPQKSKNLTA